jgi:hypothetical protein
MFMGEAKEKTNPLYGCGKYKLKVPRGMCGDVLKTR